MADLRIVDAPVLLQESITDDVKMPTGGLGNYAIRLGDLVWYVVAKENLASKSYVDNSSKGVKDELDGHIANKNNPHEVTKEQVGLGNVNNTADVDKPVSNAVSSAIITATTDMATKAYVNQRDNLKADKATTLSGYGITDAYTKDSTYSKTEIDSKEGDLTTLSTTDKTNLVKAINEIHDNTKGVVAIYDTNIAHGYIPAGWIGTLAALPFNRNQREKNLNYITPFDFGAIGDGQSHKLSTKYAKLADAQKVYPIATSLDDEIDWCALQTMINYALSQQDNRKSTIDWSGNFYLNKGLRYVVNNSGTGAFRSINGDLHFTLRNDFDQSYEAVITIHGRGISHTGVISGNCANLVDNGIVISSRAENGGIDYINMGIKIDRVFIDNARLFAIDFRNNSMFSTLSIYRGGGCGKGSTGTNNLLKTNFTTKTDSGVGGLSSSSVITVDTLPPYAIDKTTTFISSGGYVSKVTNIDTANKQITVKPHLPTSSTGEISYIYGGGVKISGTDSASCYIGQISAIGCGIALAHQTMYPATVSSFTTEFSGIAIYDFGLVSGANILTHYVEGDDYVLVQDKTHAKDYGSTTFHHGLPLEFSRIQNITWGRNSDGTTTDLFGGMAGVRIYDKSIEHSKNPAKLPKNVIPNGVNNGFGIDFNKPHDNLVVKSDNIGIGILPIDVNFNKLFAYDSQDLTVVGTGSNGSPIGTITIIPVTGYTLNGGTTNLAFSDFNSAAKFTFFLDVVNKDIKVSVSGIKSVPLSVNGRLTTGDTEQLDVDTKLWFYSNTSATGLPIPTTGAIVDGNITTYFSVANSNNAHRKTQVVYYPDLFETWERVYASSSGAYGTWRLINYQVSKGTTAQRPAKPYIGMRYYDTTLVTNGKPIEWNGSSWIDMTGATV